MNAIISVVGKDHVGIMAEVCNFLAKTNVNILDVGQTITGGYFNMTMIVDYEKSNKKFQELRDDLNEIGKTCCCTMTIQKEEIFDSMHRI